MAQVEREPKPVPPPQPTEAGWAAWMEAAQRHLAGEHLDYACRYAVAAGISDDEFIATAREVLAEARRKARIEELT